ncbi:hypothetical protein TcG_07483 [Trypanosoma cruzi]|nr:hypothetical protein TcG_07483 [Trypanosoma cruzi]
MYRRHCRNGQTYNLRPTAQARNLSHRPRAGVPHKHGWPPRSGAWQAVRCAGGVAAAALVSWRKWLTPVASRAPGRCGKPTSSGKPEKPGTPSEPPPATFAGTRARDGKTIAPPPWAAQPRPKPFPAFSALRRASRENGLGFHHHHLRNQGCPPTSGRRLRECDDLAATTPFQCISCGPRDKTKAGLLPQMRAHERPKAEPQQAPRIAALLQRPFCDKQAGNTGGLATHTHGKSISTARRARRQKWR